MIEETLKWAGADGATKVRSSSGGRAPMARRMRGTSGRARAGRLGWPAPAAARARPCLRLASASARACLPAPSELATQMVDVGCGIGGSSRHIARKLGCSARGITLSPVQVRDELPALHALAPRSLLSRRGSRGARPSSLRRRRVPTASPLQQAWRTECRSKWGVRGSRGAGWAGVA